MKMNEGKFGLCLGCHNMPVLDGKFAAFITNLRKYNEGELMGEWVKFPTTVEELKEVFERIGIGSKDEFGQPYEEWFITDYECYGRDIRLEEGGRFTDEGHIRSNGDNWDRQFDGSLDDIPDEYRITGSAESQEQDSRITVAVVEEENIMTNHDKERVENSIWILLQYKDETTDILVSNEWDYYDFINILQDINEALK